MAKKNAKTVKPLIDEDRVAAGEMLAAILAHPESSTDPLSGTVAVVKPYRWLLMVEGVRIALMELGYGVTITAGTVSLEGQTKGVYNATYR